jgi:diaminohydroxyphosphoribosylaminopyrimidine deaminase/5-amino-6-(5-phosphoribosylamino)uracil reductase
VESLARDFERLEMEVKVERESLLAVFHELRNLADQVIERELGSPLFEGIPLKWLERAVELAELSKPEDDGPRPKVGAVILSGDRLLAEASRNQDGKGGHAEQIAVESCSDPRELNGSVVLTTLEPCTVRGSRGRRPCAELLLRFGIAKVLIGLPDPNPEIRGRGDLVFRKNGITLSYFPSGLAHRLWKLNSNFIAHHTADEFRKVFLFRN